MCNAPRERTILFAACDNCNWESEFEHDPDQDFLPDYCPDCDSYKIIIKKDTVLE